ncbi:hypothetical protein R1sor_008911 [Riccia sorocarpa]|uniref:Reverse transcriptase domain-containing protein n=1 Tax=Riccia sorocarpa TaxID=122646 RepID=A0ABD3H734_9MARC
MNTLIIATIPAVAAMKSENEKGRIQPLMLGNGLVVSCIALADDFAFFTEIDRRDVDNLLLLLSQLEIASGAKINLKKSKLILIGPQLRFPAWTRQLDLTLVASNEVTNYLGAPLTTIGKCTTKGAALTGRMEAKTKYFSSPFLSFESRILIAKHALFPTLMYQFFTTTFKRGTLKRIESIIKDFVWNADREGKGPMEHLRELIFLTARSTLGMAEASEKTTSLVAACRENVGAFLDGKRARKMGFTDVACSFCGGGIEDVTHAVWLCPRWAGVWKEIANKFRGCQQILELRESLALLPDVLMWTLEEPKEEIFFRLWMLALVWRILWSERCTFRFQAKNNFVSATRIATCFLEEVWAKREKLKDRERSDLARILLQVVPHVSPRYNQLLPSGAKA